MTDKWINGGACDSRRISRSTKSPIVYHSPILQDNSIARYRIVCIISIRNRYSMEIASRFSLID